MNYQTRDGIAVLEGVEAVRVRPSMYIGVEEPGRSLRGRLLEVVVVGLAQDTPRPRNVRIQLWKDGAMTVAYDGAPIPIEPFSRPVDGVAHPIFYQFFAYLLTGSRPFGRSLSFGAVLNALSERLVVSTIHAHDRYRAVFSRGNIVTLLARVSCDAPLGTAWFTFSPDATIISGTPITADEAQVIADRARHGLSDVNILVEDRTTEGVDWY